MVGVWYYLAYETLTGHADSSPFNFLFPVLTCGNGRGLLVVVAEEITALGGRDLDSSIGAQEIKAKKDPFHQRFTFLAGWEKTWV